MEESAVLSTTPIQTCDLITLLLRHIGNDRMDPRPIGYRLDCDGQQHHRDAWNGSAGIRQQAHVAGVLTDVEQQTVSWALESYRELAPRTRHSLNKLMTLLFDWRKHSSLESLALHRPRLTAKSRAHRRPRVRHPRQRSGGGW